VSTVTPTFPNTVIEMPEFATDSAAGLPVPDRTFKQAIGAAAYEQAGIGPDDVDVAEVYDLSTALELDWYEDLGFCGPGEAEKLLRDGVTALGGRLPVNPSGGLACFGEAVPAQALAQVCEITWQLRGQAEGRQAGIGPEDVQVAEVYDLSTALELDWYEDLGFCGAGEAEKLLHDGVTELGGRLPVNPSGGLACFGEAVPAQALAQVCELTWQLRGTAEGRQADAPTVGITANQGLFGHGSSVIVVR
jgi:acetyl-CoA acetyltransferase